jgi:tape measure domain-containing protein
VERMRWIIELIDRMSGPARQAGASVQNIIIILDRNDRAVKRSTSTWAQLVSAWDHGINILSRLASVATSVGSILWEGSKFALGALAFKESTQESFRLMLGTREEADKLFSQAVEFGARTPFETKGVIDSFRQLMSSGFKKEEVPILFQALGDISAASGFDTQSISAITTQLAQVKALGHLTMQDLRIITSWSGQAGVGLQTLYKQLAETLHVPASALPKMQQAGTISADAFIYSFVKAVKERTAAKELGTIMETQSRTLIGLWSTIKSAPSDFFFRMTKHVGEMHGVEQLKSAMENVITLLAAGSPEAERLGNLIERVFGDLLETVFGPLNGPEGLEGMRRTLDDVVTRLEKVDWKEIFAEAKTFIMDTAEAVMYLAKGIGYVVTGLNEIRHPGSYYERQSKGTVRELTAAERNEIRVAGMGEDTSSDLGPAEAVGMRAYVHSSMAKPKLDDDLEAVLARVPKMAEGGIVSRPTLAVIGEAGPEAVVPLGGADYRTSEFLKTANRYLAARADPNEYRTSQFLRTAAQAHIASSAQAHAGGIEIGELHIHIHAEGDVNDPHSLAQALADLSPGALALGLERLADEVG